MTPETMTRDQRSMLLYCESVCVDGGGLLVGARMNAEDHKAMADMMAAGLVSHWGRIPGSLLLSDEGPRKPTGVTHYVELTDRGWEVAHALRRERAQRKGPFAIEVFAHEKTLERKERQHAAV